MNMGGAAITWAEAGKRNLRVTVEDFILEHPLSLRRLQLMLATVCQASDINMRSRKEMGWDLELFTDSGDAPSLDWASVETLNHELSQLPADPVIALHSSRFTEMCFLLVVDFPLVVFHAQELNRALGNEIRHVLIFEDPAYKRSVMKIFAPLVFTKDEIARLERRIRWYLSRDLYDI
jgi:hypothetical protein